MGFGWVNRNLSPIGIDFGTDSLKLLQVAHEDPPQIVAAAAMDVPFDVRTSAATRQAFLGQALRELVRDGAFKAKRAVISIPAAQTYVRHLRVARTEELPMEDLIANEMRSVLPMDPTGMVMRHVQVGEVFTDGNAKLEVICLAAGREAIMRYVQTTRGAGFNVVGMHAEAMAIIQAFAHLYRRQEDVERTTMFVDIGAATTKALIAHGHQLVFAKSIEVAGDHFNRQLAKAKQIELSEARHQRIQRAAEAPKEVVASPPPAPPLQGREQQHPRETLALLDAAMKAAGAAPSPAADDQPPAADEPAAQTAGAAAQTVEAAPQTQADEAEAEMLDCLVDELQLCVGYHASLFADRSIDKMIFLGGESRNIGLCQRIAQALRIPAQVGDPVARLDRRRGGRGSVGLDLRQPQPAWAVPLGLCLLPTNL